MPLPGSSMGAIDEPSSETQAKGTEGSSASWACPTATNPVSPSGCTARTSTIPRGSTPQSRHSHSRPSRLRQNAPRVPAGLRAGSLVDPTATNPAAVLEMSLISVNSPAASTSASATRVQVSSSTSTPGAGSENTRGPSSALAGCGAGATASRPGSVNSTSGPGRSVSTTAGPSVAIATPAASPAAAARAHDSSHQRGRRTRPMILA